MFTGIVTATGSLAAVDRRQGGMRLAIELASGNLELADSRTGDSVSVSGVCLTMVELDAQGFRADVSAETLALTTLGGKNVNDRVNLELALRAGDRLGGHLVSGHVDAAVALLSRQSLGEAEILEFELPKALSHLVSRKGSVCVDGVSLTVNTAGADRFSVCVIPHTLTETTLGPLEAGHQVNLEVDQIARYLARLVEGQRQ